MSDPAWASRTVVDGADSLCSIMTAGTTAAPGTADELGFVTEIQFSGAANVTEKGPYINLSTVKKTLASYNYSGSMTVDVASGADTVRNRLFDAITNKTRVRVVAQIGNEVHSFDQCIIGADGTINPAEGGQYTFNFEADSYTKTNAAS